MFDKLVSVLPPHSTELERNLEMAGWYVMREDMVNTWNPDTMPEHLLPYLAWGLSVDEWDPSWPVETKRAVIKSAPEIHRKKGTVGSVKKALAAFGVDLAITEWWQQSPRGIPHTFVIEVSNSDLQAAMATLSMTDNDFIDLVIRVVTATKPVRSHFSVVVVLSTQSHVYLRSGIDQTGINYDRHIVGTRPHIVEHSAYVRAAVRQEYRQTDRATISTRPHIIDHSAYVRNGARMTVVNETRAEL